MEGQRGLPTRGHALALHKEHQTRDYNVHMEDGVGWGTIPGFHTINL